MFESICIKLFGEGEKNQEKLLIKLTLISSITFLIAVFMNVGGAIALPFLIWGWRALCACIGVTQISRFFEYNIVIIIISILIWLALGMFAGIFVSIIGVVRLIQLEIKRYKKRKNNN